MAFTIERERIRKEGGFLGFGQKRTAQVVERSVLMEGACSMIFIGGRRLGTASLTTSGVLEIEVDPHYARIGGSYGVASDPNEVINASDWADTNKKKVIRAFHSRLTFWSSPRADDAEDMLHFTRLKILQ